MAMKFAELERIENARRIERDTAPEFWHHLKRGLLLALAESGRLQPACSRQALKELERERTGRGKP